jgi:hypothetical protein
VTGLLTPLFTRDNLVVYTWAAAVTQLLAGNINYAVGAAYLQYQNCVNPTDVVPVPAYDRTRNTSYFSNLPSNQDYLRVPLVGTPTISIGAGYGQYFTTPLGNQVTFTVLATGVVGVNGLPYSAANNSKIFGMSLVATPGPTAAQDVLISSGYYATIDQQLKLVGSQVQSAWTIELE